MNCRYSESSKFQDENETGIKEPIYGTCFSKITCNEPGDKTAKAPSLGVLRLDYEYATLGMSIFEQKSPVTISNVELF